MPALQKAKELRRSTSFCPQSFLLGHLRMSRFLEARLEEADARRSSFEKQARQIAAEHQGAAALHQLRPAEVRHKRTDTFLQVAWLKANAGE